MRNEILRKNKEPKQRKTIIFIFGIVTLLFAYLVMKEVELPSGVLLFVGALSFIILSLTMITRSDVILYVLVVYLPFSKILAGDFGGFMTAVNFTNILTFMALFTWISGTMVKNRRFYTRTSLDIPLFIFMFLGCLSLVKGIQYFEQGYGSELIFPLKRWLTPMFLFFIFFNTIRSKREIKNITVIIMFVMTIVALMAIKDYMGVRGGTSIDKARVYGIAGQPNILAAFFVYYMFLFAGFMLVYRKNFRYWFLFFPFLACFRGIQVTFSRGAYIAFAGAALAIAFFRSKMLFALTAFVLIFAVLNPQFLPKGMQYRMSSTFRDDQLYAQSVDEVVDAGSKKRIEAWKGGIKMIKERPLFGFGYSVFPHLIPQYAPVSYMDAHNAYILIAAEMGIPALLMFLLILYIIFINTRKLYVRTNDKFFKALALGFLGGLGGVFVANIFGGRLDSQEVSSYFWILAAVVFKALYLERQESKRLIKK